MMLGKIAATTISAAILLTSFSDLSHANRFSLRGLRNITVCHQANQCLQWGKAPPGMFAGPCLKYGTYTFVVPKGQDCFYQPR